MDQYGKWDKYLGYIFELNRWDSCPHEDYILNKTDTHLTINTWSKYIVEYGESSLMQWEKNKLHQGKELAVWS